MEALAAGPAALEYRAHELEVIKHIVDGAMGPAAARRASLLGAEASVMGILHARPDQALPVGQLRSLARNVGTYAAAATLAIPEGPRGP